jgi:hypothetical protein
MPEKGGMKQERAGFFAAKAIQTQHYKHTTALCVLTSSVPSETGQDTETVNALILTDFNKALTASS